MGWCGDLSRVKEWKDCLGLGKGLGKGLGSDCGLAMDGTSTGYLKKLRQGLDRVCGRGRRCVTFFSFYVVA